MGDFIKLCNVNEVEEGKLASFDTIAGYIAVTRKGDEYFAFEDVCTHDGECISTGKMEGDIITCPRHFAKFDIKTGEVLAMPATSPLTIFPARKNGNIIEIEVGN